MRAHHLLTAKCSVLAIIAYQIGVSASAADATAGKQFFQQQCVTCHTAEPGDNGGAQGPALGGILGRRAASDSTFTYTAALGKSQLIWDEATLQRFLQAPDTLVPGTAMAVAVPNSSDRDNLIAYFQSTRFPASAEQLSSDPFVAPIEATQGVIELDFVEFARIPDAQAGEAPRMMHLVDEPETKRYFVSTMRGMLYSVSHEGKTVAPYLDINAEKWNVAVQFSGPERGLQSFAFHPQFTQRGRPGYGKFYTYTDTSNTTPTADFSPNGQSRTHDTVLLEWTAKNPRASVYDGDGPRELFRAAHPFPNHNGGQIAFNPLAKPGAEDYGLLYVGFADGGSGGDPLHMGQNLGSAFGKILRIDPAGSNSANGRYGIPSTNPFVQDNKPETLGELYAYGVRNPQRFTWDSNDGRMYLADIGQNQVEEISPVTAGANLGWNLWEGSYRYVDRQVDLNHRRGEPGLAWPVVEYDHKDPLLQRGVAITGIAVYRSKRIAQLDGKMIFGDIPSGEIFYVNVDALPSGGHQGIRRILLKDGRAPKTLLQLIREKNASQGKEPAPRADLRFGFGSRGEVFLLNKRDGVIRQLK